MPTPREVLAQNRADAMSFVQHSGIARARDILGSAEQELVQRLNLVPGNAGTFSYDQMQAALAQVRNVIYGIRTGMRDVLVDGSLSAADRATNATVNYLGQLDAQMRGVGTQPIALNEALMFESARVGARASILRRIGSSGTGAPGAPLNALPAKPGILDRYGMNTVREFEAVLQKSLLTRKPWEATKAELVSSSPFLQQKPAFWAERIVRTELMGAYNRAGWEAHREADDQLGDMVKILSATFDDRTGSDSFAYHGQIRRPEEAFQSWDGLYQHPPNRPNDREIVVPHRISWPIPPFLKWKADGEVAARWKLERRRGSPPPRPRMTTIEVGRFGREAPPKASEPRAPRPAVPPEG